MSGKDRPTQKSSDAPAAPEHDALTPDGLGALLLKGQLKESEITRAGTGSETPPKPDATAQKHLPDVDVVEAAKKEIAQHEKADASRSYLGQAISYLSSSDEKSLARLKELTTAYDGAARRGDQEAAEKARLELTQQVEADRKARESQDDYVHYGSGFLKAAGLFSAGKAGLWGTAAAYALDQMNPNDSLSTQMLDGGLGVGKGFALRGIFSKLGSAEVGIAAKGVGLGVSSRLAETILTRQTYMDGQGKFDLGKGLKAIESGTFSKEALVTDVAVFGLAHGLIKGGNSITLGALERSPMLSTMFTASSFGLVSGAGHEVQRQMGEGRTLSTFDYTKIAKKGLIQGAVDSLAGAPGGMQARAASIAPTVGSIREAGETRSVPRSQDSPLRLPGLEPPGSVPKGAAPGELALDSARILDFTSPAAGEFPREAAPGVYVRETKGVLDFERDIMRLSPEQRGEMMRDVQSPLFEFEVLDALSTRVLDATSRWSEDLTPRKERVDRSYEEMHASGKEYQREVLDEGLVPISVHHEAPNDIFLRRAAMEYIGDNPSALRLFENYVEARAKHGEEIRVLTEQLHQRRADLQRGLDEFTDQAGLPRFKIETVDDLGSAAARYKMGKGVIQLRNSDLHDTRDTSGLVGHITHELNHGEQDFTIVRRAADLVGIGKAANAEQLTQLGEVLKLRSGSLAEPEFLKQCLERRNGEPLDDVQAARADELAEAFLNNKPMGADYTALANHFRVSRRELKQVDDVNGPLLLFTRLARDKSGTLAEHLFGDKTLPPDLAKLAAHSLKVMDGADPSLRWPKDKIRAYVKPRIEQRMRDLNRDMLERYKDYMAGLHEREAWVVGERGRFIAEGRGGTKPDTRRNPRDEIEALLRQLDEADMAANFKVKFD